jgi:hypothetical protein
MARTRITRSHQALAALVAAATLVLLVSLPALAGTRTFKAVILENFEIRASAQPCDVLIDGFSCPGTGTVQGFGPVTSTIFFPFDPPYPLTRTLELADGSTLVLEEMPLGGSRPGASAYAPGQQVSAGNPGFDNFAWSVVDGTGVFAGAVGSGTWENVQAGDTIVIRFTGTLTLP